jgi:hypothetical protein
MVKKSTQAPRRVLSSLLLLFAGNSLCAAGGTPPPSPLELRAERAPAAAGLFWIDPALTGENAVTGHDLEVAAGPDYATWVPAQLAGRVDCQAGNPAPCRVTVTGLSNGTAYKARVRAVNLAGAGAWVVLHNWVTPEVTEQLPGVPTQLLGRVGPGSVTGEWTPVTSVGEGASAIIRYRLVVLADGKLAGHCDTTGTPAPPTCTVTGLSSGVPYTLKVRAFNDQRKYSDFSAAAGPYTPN